MAKITEQQTALAAPDALIEICPYAPGLLLMTIPVGLVIPEAHAVKLLGQIHDALDKLRKLDQAGSQPDGLAVKNGLPSARKVADAKRKG